MAKTIITGTDGYTIGGAIHGSTLDGLWFAGLPGTNNKIQSIQAGTGALIQNCVFINMPEAIDGLTDNCSVKNCIFINCGWGTLSHSIYYNSSQSVYHLLENNIFIGGLAYHMHLWHSASNVTIRKNFSARAVNNIVLQGDGHDVSGNFFWSSTNITCNFSSGDYYVHDNYFGSEIIDNPGGAGIINNHFYGAVDFGANPVHHTWDDFAALTSYTKAQIDNAAYFLDNARTFTREQLLEDTTIAANAAMIRDMMNKVIL